jgi:hypothetical protein
VLNAFLNPWMLAGLAGVLLPVIAHLLSRNKYDQVDWGAMQFLELDPNAKRRIRLEELLLLLVRMGLIVLVTLALARPWIQSQWMGSFSPKQPRDIVLIIDGSYSMGWDANGNGKTSHLRSLQLARDFLRDMQVGDAVQVIHAIEQPHVMLPELTHDPYRVKETINDLPVPAGSADLVAAVRKGIQLLALGTNLQREVIVITDLQASSWKASDETLWAQLEDLRTQSAIVPRVWVIDASDGEVGRGPNFAIDRLQLSRELAIKGTSIRISSRVKSFGGEEVSLRKVHLEIDQIRLDDQSVRIKVPPKGEITVDFEHRFDTVGSHLISLVLDDDCLSGDNRSDAVVTVTESLPVLLVDGDRKPDPTRSETFFAQAALLATGDEQPWISASVITPEELTADCLKSVSVVVIANVSQLTDSAISELQKFVRSGHGLIFTLGDQINREHYRTVLYALGKGLLPCQLDSIVNEDENQKRGVRIQSSSLELPWLQAFRADRGGTLSDARWSRWWKLAISNQEAVSPEDPLSDDALDRKPLTPAQKPASDPLILGTAIEEVRLTTGDPLLVSRRFGNGTTAVFASTIDADWNTLPAKQDFVPFLYEMLFSLAVPVASRNLDADAPLVLTVPGDLKIEDFHFLNPVNKSFPGERIKDAFQPTVRLRETRLPGIYRFVRKSAKPNDLVRPEYFVINFDRAESDVTPLSETDRELLSQNDRMKFVEGLPDLRTNMYTETSRTEIWWMLLYVFLGFLAIETWMTRRMVQGGYVSEEVV